MKVKGSEFLKVPPISIFNASFDLQMLGALLYCTISPATAPAHGLAFISFARAPCSLLPGPCHRVEPRAEGASFPCHGNLEFASTTPTIGAPKPR